MEIQGKSEAEAIFREMAPVVPLVSHELNTALAAVLGNAHILRERADQLATDDRTAALRDIESHAERLFSAIQNLLLYARLENGEMPYCQPILLCDLVEEEITLEHRRRPDRRVRLRTNAVRQPISADERLLKVVLRNLLENAYQYARAATPISIFLAQDSEALRLHVLDRGPGVAEAEKQQLFRPFFRSPSVADHHPGLGLGLTVAQNIAALHGGRIDVTNRKSGGACFCLTLPIHQAAF